ncbi:MAG: hypothetical protein DRP87_18705 [Spirochaetes bacterium]|nr:MAG: hypothetical protein DRP87_18705 [Spirochaetota bacterium]
MKVNNNKPFLALLLLLLPLAVFSEEASVVYTEGEVDIKYRSGERWEAMIGDLLERGDTVITGKSGMAEIEERPYNLYKVSPDTVFTLMEVEQGGKKQAVLSCTLGSVALKFEKVMGSEPVITTPSMIAGVRGTELTVFAGLDGSSLVIVEEGEVEVTSEGKAVVLNPEEGVEVRPGEPPGEKFRVLRGQIDFSTWNSERFRAFMDDPVESALGVEKRLNYYIGEIDSLLPSFIENKSRVKEERKKLDKLEKEKGKEARAEYYQKEIFPLEVKTSYMAMNIRYYALSALSLRRFILGRMYMFMRSLYITEPENEIYSNFIDVYRRIIDAFEEKVVPHLVEADI